MDPSASTDLQGERANELYWSSDSSVNQIADSLDLSKSTLYALIQPLPADLSCPSCSTGLEYPNRTARERKFVSCPECGYEADVEAAKSDGAQENPDASKGTGGPPTEITGTSSAPSGGSGTDRAFLGAALIGLAAAIALVFWARRR